jgi:hypothetical protein
MNQPYPEVNYRRVFESLETIIGFPLKRKGRKYYAARYASGEVSARPDKLTCWMSKGAQPVVMVCEAGGDCLPIYQWLVKYGGCIDYAEAYQKLLSLDRSNIIIPEERVRIEIPLRHVYPDIMERTEKQRVKTPDNFSRYLYGMVGRERAEPVLAAYHVGSIPCRIPNLSDGVVGWSDEQLTIFWYINSDGKINHDKRIFYNPNGHRCRTWTGKRTFRIDDGFRGRCLFGSHLLYDRQYGEKIYVTESEKSAVICRAYFGEGVWLAAGGNNYLRHEDVRADFVLLADRDAHEMWSKKFTQCQVPKWWEAYEAMGWVCGEKDDIGDAIEWVVNNKK